MKASAFDPSTPGLIGFSPECFIESEPSDTMWREITESDVQGVFSAPELAAIQAAAIADGQDPMTDLLAWVIHQARGYIGDNKANRLAEGLTLPERCIRPALHMLRPDLLTRLDLEVSNDRRGAAKDAIRFFERVADGNVQIEQPDGATDDSGAAQAMEVVSGADRLFTRQKQSGL